METEEPLQIGKILVLKLDRSDRGIHLALGPEAYRTLRIPESVAKRVYLKSLVIMKSSERR